VTTKACRLIVFDFEKQNPRVKSYLEDGFGAFAFQMNAHFKSHGETINALLTGLLERVEKDRKRAKLLVLLDEPDMALSPRSAAELARTFQKIAAAGHQVLAAVHNPIVISSQPEVFSVEHRRWMTPAEFFGAHHVNLPLAEEKP
jgi:predicted ATPase